MNLLRCLAVCVSLLAILFAGSAYAQIVLPIHMELMEGMPEKDGTPIPPNGSTWHELYPNHCTVHTQINYEDNGDGYISACDVIRYDIGRAHIERVVPTLYLYNEQAGTVVVEPEVTGGNYHEVYPGYCGTWQPFGDNWWTDGNANGVIDGCDYLILVRPGETFGFEFHVEAVETNIIIDTLSPVEPGAWGKIKSFFSQIF